MLVAALIVSTRVAFGADIFSGLWKLNIEKSHFSPGPILRPRGPNFTEIDSVSNGFTFVSDGVDANGRKTHGDYTGTLDGKILRYTQIVDGPKDPDSAPTVVSLKRLTNAHLS
jgi:hypothetical protein